MLFCRAEVWRPVVGIVPSGNADVDGELDARGDAEPYVDTAKVAFDGLGGYRQRLVGLDDVAGRRRSPAASPEIAQSEEKVSDGGGVATADLDAVAWS